MNRLNNRHNKHSKLMQREYLLKWITSNFLREEIMELRKILSLEELLKLSIISSKKIRKNGKDIFCLNLKIQKIRELKVKLELELKDKKKINQ